jgi:hypothetical protein
VATRTRTGRTSARAAARPLSRLAQASRPWDAGPAIPSHLLQAILATLCFLPFGVVSLVHAMQVSGRVAAGDLAGAQQASARARRWAWIAFLVALGLFLVYAVVMSWTAAYNRGAWR